MGGRAGSWGGRLGLFASFLLWVASTAALLAPMRANEAARLLARESLHAAGRVDHLRGLAVMWCFVLAGLQIGAGLVGALVLRGIYGLRSAVCFALSGGTVVVLNVLWLFGLLISLRVYGETR